MACGVSLAMLAAILAASSPAPEVMVGLSTRDGRPLVVFVACNRSLAIVNVYEHDPVRQASPDPLPSQDGPRTWTVRSESPQLVTEIDLFGEPPLGWHVSEATLTSLDPAVHYSAGGISLRQAIPVEFTVADLANLSRDQVLSADRREAKVMTRAAFEATATGACPR